MTSAAAELRKLVDAYFERHPKASVPSLAKEAGVSASTLRRNLQNETAITMNTAWAVLSVICKSGREVFEAMVKIFPETGHLLEPMAKKDTVDFLSAPQLREAVRDVLRTRTGFIVLNLASMDCGTSREIVQRATGQSGVRLIEILLDKGIVTDNQGRISMRSFAHNDAPIIIDQIGMIAEVFDPSLIGTPGAFAALKTASVTMGALIEVKEHAKQFYAKIVEITEDPKNSGELPLAFGAIMTLLDAEALKEGGVS